MRPYDNYSALVSKMHLYDNYSALVAYIAYIRVFIHRRNSKLLIMQPLLHLYKLNDLTKTMENTPEENLNNMLIGIWIRNAESVARDIDESVVIQTH